MATLVGLVHAADGQDPGTQRLITGCVGQHQGLVQRPASRCVPACLQIDECELPQDVGDQVLTTGGAGRPESAVQHHGALSIEPAY